MQSILDILKELEEHPELYPERKWPSLSETILIIITGILLIIVLYQHGGLSAGLPYSLVGLLGYLLIGYAIMAGTFSRKKKDTRSEIIL